MQCQPFGDGETWSALCRHPKGLYLLKKAVQAGPLNPLGGWGWGSNSRPLGICAKTPAFHRQPRSAH